VRRWRACPARVAYPPSGLPPSLRPSTPRLGTNGIGKSTALNVLSGKLKPNLGKPKEPPDWHEILAYYRGSELQKYFTRMLEDDLRVSIKARQRVHGQHPRACMGSTRAHACTPWRAAARAAARRARSPPASPRVAAWGLGCSAAAVEARKASPQPPPLGAPLAGR